MAMEYEWAGDVRQGGEWLRRHRERMGMTQRDVDRMSGISAQNISSLENGLISKPSMPMLVQIGALYGVTPNDIAEAYGWWRVPTQIERDERLIYLDSVLNRLSDDQRNLLLRQVEIMAQLAEREIGHRHKG